MLLQYWIPARISLAVSPSEGARVTYLVSVGRSDTARDHLVAGKFALTWWWCMAGGAIAIGVTLATIGRLAAGALWAARLAYVFGGLAGAGLCVLLMLFTSRRGAVVASDSNEGEMQPNFGRPWDFWIAISIGLLIAAAGLARAG